MMSIDNMAEEQSFAISSTLVAQNDFNVTWGQNVWKIVQHVLEMEWQNNGSEKDKVCSEKIYLKLQLTVQFVLSSKHTVPCPKRCTHTILPGLNLYLRFDKLGGSRYKVHENCEFHTHSCMGVEGIITVLF